MSVSLTVVTAKSPLLELASTIPSSLAVVAARVRRHVCVACIRRTSHRWRRFRTRPRLTFLVALVCTSHTHRRVLHLALSSHNVHRLQAERLSRQNLRPKHLMGNTRGLNLLLLCGQHLPLFLARHQQRGHEHHSLASRVLRSRVTASSAAKINWQQPVRFKRWNSFCFSLLCILLSPCSLIYTLP